MEQVVINLNERRAERARNKKPPLLIVDDYEVTLPMSMPATFLLYIGDAKAGSIATEDLQKLLEGIFGPTLNEILPRLDMDDVIDVLREVETAYGVQEGEAPASATPSPDTSES